VYHPSTYESHVPDLPIKYPQSVRRIAVPRKNDQKGKVRSYDLDRDAAMPVLERVLHNGDHGLLCLRMMGSHRILGL